MLRIYVAGLHQPQNRRHPPVSCSVAQTVLGVMTVVQFIIMLVNNKQPNERLAEFGTDLGIWIAKAARYQTAASNVKPWPWTDLD